MKTTAAVLMELQDYYDSLDPKPRLKEISIHANMPVATVSRHLNGTTKQGIPSRVRALAIALGRQDLADEVVVETPTQNADAWWIVELQRELREDNLEELERERQLRKESEQRFERIVASKDESIRRLTDRIDKLEDDKTELAAEKASLTAEVKRVNKKKRLYEGIIVGLFLLLALYFIIFDLPYPDSGITEVLIQFFKKGGGI